MTIVEAAALGALPLVHRHAAHEEHREASSAWRVEFERLAAGYLEVVVVHNGTRCDTLTTSAAAAELAAACFAAARGLPEVGACDLLGDPLPLPPAGMPVTGTGSSAVLGIDWTRAPEEVGADLAAWLVPATLPPPVLAHLRQQARSTALSWQGDGTAAALQHALASVSHRG